MTLTPEQRAALLASATPAELARAWAESGDEDQAQFFIEAALVAAEWPPGNMDQWYAVGGHLGTCACSSDEARYLVQRIADGIGTHDG